MNDEKVVEEYYMFREWKMKVKERLYCIYWFVVNISIFFKIMLSSELCCSSKKRGYYNYSHVGRLVFRLNHF